MRSVASGSPSQWTTRAPKSCGNGFAIHIYLTAAATAAAAAAAIAATAIAVAATIITATDGGGAYRPRLVGDGQAKKGHY